MGQLDLKNWRNIIAIASAIGKDHLVGQNRLQDGHTLGLKARRYCSGYGRFILHNSSWKRQGSCTSCGGQWAACSQKNANRVGAHNNAAMDICFSRASYQQRQSKANALPHFISGAINLLT